MDIDNLRKEIPALGNNIYFNTGTEGPTPNRVLSAQMDMLKALADNGPAAWPMLLMVNRTMANCREAIADFIGAAPDEIALTHNASEGINIVAAGLDLRPGDSVIISDLEHVSGILPWLHWAKWRGIHITNLQTNHGMLGADQVEAAFTPQTRLVCMSHVSYASGARLPVAEVCRLAGERGIPVLVDGAQAVGQIPVDVHALDCDFYALPGQKWLLGPAGTGALYVKKAALDSIQPTSIGWASVTNDDATDELQLHPSARRFEVATVHGPSLAGWLESIRLLAEIGIDAISSRIASLAKTAREALAEVPGLRVLGPEDAALWTGLLPFQIEDHDPKTIVQRLWREAHVISRWIPHPYCVRFSLHVFNTEAEIAKVSEFLRTLTRNES